MNSWGNNQGERELERFARKEANRSLRHEENLAEYEKEKMIRKEVSTENTEIKKTRKFFGFWKNILRK